MTQTGISKSSLAAGMYSVIRILYYSLDVVEVILAFRFMLRLLGANSALPFVVVVYSLTAPLVAPFQGIFAPVAVQGTVVEWASLVAMLVYALAAYAVLRLISYFFLEMRSFLSFL